MDSPRRAVIGPVYRISQTSISMVAVQRRRAIIYTNVRIRWMHNGLCSVRLHNSWMATSPSNTSSTHIVISIASSSIQSKWNAYRAQQMVGATTFFDFLSFSSNFPNWNCWFLWHFIAVTFQLALNRDWNGWSEDLEMNDMINGVISKRKIVLLAATTQIVEDPIYQSKRSKVFILYERIPKTIRFRRRKNTASFTWLTMVQNEKDGIEDLFQYLHANAHDLLKTHTIEWNNFWSEHGISVDGNAELSKSIQSSLYAIASNLPSLRSFSSNEPFYGLSSCGLGSGGPMHEGYEGHSLWDSETWLLPSILLIEPKWSQELLKYRHDVREAARQHANNTGFQGLRWN